MNVLTTKNINYTRLFLFPLVLIFSFLKVYTQEISKILEPNIFGHKKDLIYAQADSIMRQMSTREKVAQCFMIIQPFLKDQKSLNTWQHEIKRQKYGGILFRHGTPEQQLQMTNLMRRSMEIPMLVAIDGEWGLSMRLRPTTKYPYNMLLGASNDSKLLKEYGKRAARACKRLGIHIMFAPVLDVNNEPLNPVIGKRSYGEDPVRVSLLGSSYAFGLEENGVLSCAKHFPGHGNTKIDSHKALPTIYGKREELQKVELLPFRTYVSRGLGSVMVGHLYVPSLSNAASPASVNKDIITDLLRNQMGFDGLIITDALEMKGIAGIKANEVAYQSFLAGADILLGSPRPINDIDYITQKIKSGAIEERILDDKCQRILAFKIALGAMDKSPLPSKNLRADLNTKSDQDFVSTLCDASVTLLKNDGVLPLNSSSAITLINQGRNPFLAGHLKKDSSPISIRKSLRFSYKNSETYYTQQIQNSKSNTVILFICDDYQKESLSLLRSLKGQKLISIFLCSPYTLKHFSKTIDASSAVVLGYENTTSVQKSIEKTLLGEIRIQGKLPVSINSSYPVGTGLNLDNQKDNNSSPLDTKELGLSTKRLSKIDQIAEEGLSRGAYSGCRVLVMKNGVVAYDKSFGYLDRQKKNLVSEHSLYDLASVTKAIATTSLLMKAYETGKLQLSDRLVKYLPYLKGSPVGLLRIETVARHYGGLPAFLRFYESLIDPLSYRPPLVTYRRRGGYDIQLGRHAYARSHWKYDSKLVSNDSSSMYPVRFAKGYYLSPLVREKMRETIAQTPLKSKRFRYSDLDFLLLQDVLEHIYQKPLDVLFYEFFTRPMQLNRLLFTPYRYFDSREIAEGQYDKFLRHQSLRGDVDDEAAAMLGGVSGNAGLYGSAPDLANFVQMLCSGGQYKGIQYLQSKTIELFTNTLKSGSPYGIGFDKARLHGSARRVPPKASSATFGHTGFTGTCFWVDPDNGIVYVFLSNRTVQVRWNPLLSNLKIRRRIFDVIYEAMES